MCTKKAGRSILHFINAIYSAFLIKRELVTSHKIICFIIKLLHSHNANSLEDQFIHFLEHNLF